MYGIIKLRVRARVEEREELYESIKGDLTPLILELIKDSEKIKGHMEYWDLYHKLVDEFGLTMSDYERIIGDLKEQGLIEKQWSAGIGGFLTTKK